MRQTVVGSFGTPLEAELAAMMLRSRGIEARLQDEELVGAALQLSPLLGGVKVLVGALYADTARELLDEYRTMPKADPEALRRDPAESEVGRAFRMSIIGLILFPFGLHLYSEYLLLRNSAPASTRARWQRRIAHIINAVVIALGVVGVARWFDSHDLRATTADAP